jgi:hypothetical protein
MCPNGMNCIYRHCLPSDYVLKKNRVKDDENDDEEALLEEIEEDRKNIKFD